CMQSIDYPRTF
nr:immunoglobulin light chain junction region [Macaca mulatta]MOW42773.1 immunoglobulin light chain junction region [Macaca mulatta]